MDDRIHLSVLSVSGCAWNAWKFPLDVLSLVALEVEVAVEVEPALAQVKRQVLVAVEVLVALVSVEE